MFSHGARTSESSEMSMSASLVSNEGYGEVTATLAHIFPTVLDQDLSSVGILLEDSGDYLGYQDSRGSVYYSSGDESLPVQDLLMLGRAEAADSGEETPVSVSPSSEFDLENKEDEEVEASVSVDCDVTVVEELPEAMGVSHETGAEAEGPEAPREEDLGKLAKSVESLQLADKRVKSSGVHPGTRLVGQWVTESAESSEGFREDADPEERPCEAENAEDEERTITSSMTATSPARKSIFQVFGSPVTKQPREEPETTKKVPSKPAVVSSFTKELKLYAEANRGLPPAPPTPSPSPVNLDLPAEIDDVVLTSVLVREAIPGSPPNESARPVKSPRDAEMVDTLGTPVLTLASSFKDQSCISRGFKVVKDDTDTP